MKEIVGADGERQHLLADCRRIEGQLGADEKSRSGSGLGYWERRRRQKCRKKYYEEQEELVELYEQDAQMLHEMSTHEILEQGRLERKIQLKWDRRFATIVFLSNVVIFGANLVASILSKSLSIVSVFVDSMIDLGSSVIVHLTISAINNTDRFNYPRGRHRLEIVAVISCSIFMGVANIMLIVRSAEAIMTKQIGPNTNLTTILLMLSSIGIKFVIMLACYRHGTKHSRLLALDQRNDALTSLIGLAGAYIGSNFWVYADPICAILVCSFVAISWFHNAVEHVPLIVGRRANRRETSRILAIALKHDDRIKSITHVIVYHVGEEIQVELSIVLGADTPLHTTHKISESLRDKLNSLNFIERSFVHVECEK